MKNFLFSCNTFIIITLVFCIAFVFSANAATNRLVISEFMAINGSILADEDGEFSDWIEIHNPGSQAINLLGWSLTDNPSRLNKWTFPAMNLAAGSYLVVFASDKKRATAGRELHTNFKLSGSGEYLALVEPDQKTISYSYGESFPVQQRDVSFGLYQGNWVYFNQPTPGAENSPGNFVIAPLFSHERGFYNEAIEVALVSPMAGLPIYYTTNGTRPDAGKGTLYTGPISIATSTPVSAVVYNGESGYSNIVTNTYLFIDSIINQPAKPAGYPDKWSLLKFSADFAPSDYEMDPEVVNDPTYRNQLPDALTSIPSMVIVTDIDHIFSHDKDPEKGGIYIYTGNNSDKNRGLGWERPTSIEYIDPVNKKSFQVNCGVRLHGGNSRVPENSAKHGFRLSFRSQYGLSKLNYDLFDSETATNTFNSLVLRAGYNYSWNKNGVEQCERADYIRDPFAKNTQLDMGHLSAHNKFVHLYINNLYWGVYNVSEKITDDFMKSYMGGNEEDWDVVTDQVGLIDGNLDAWNRMLAQVKSGLGTTAQYMKIQGRNADGSINPNFENLLDVDNFIDYMLYNYYIGNKDWDKNNWLAGRNRVEQPYGFRHFAWDAETSMINVNENITNLNNSNNPSGIFNSLKKNNEFVVRVGDRIQKHFFNGGALTPEATFVRYSKLAGEINLAIMGESARWGDYRRDVHTNPANAIFDVYTRDKHWYPEVMNTISNYLPYRTNIVLNQFRAAGLYPSINAPEFSHYGGKIKTVVDLSMTAAEGDIYYTTDGSDPRMVGGAVASVSARMYQNKLMVSGSGTIMARAKKGNQWSALTQATFDSNQGGGFILNSSQVLADVTVQTYPNPFTDRVFIEYRLVGETSVKVDILSIDGRVVTTLYHGVQQAGYEKLEWAPTGLREGLYIYRIAMENKVYTGKLIFRP